MLLALILAQALQPATPEGPIVTDPASMWSPAFFEFAPANGRGLPNSADLCSTLSASEKVGGWYCMSNGAMATGSTVSLTTARGAGTVVSSQTVCPNGPACAPKTSFYVPTYAGGGDYGWTEAANVDRSAPATSWTACWEGQVMLDTAGGERHLLGLSSSGGSPWQFMIYAAPTSSSTARLYHSTAACGGTTGSTDSNLLMVSGAHHFVCASWSSSDGIFRTYVDGAIGNTSAVYATTCGGGSASRHSLGAYWNAAALGGSTQGHHFGAFYTGTQLSAARIAELARAVLADTPRGAKGESVSITRGGTQGCMQFTSGGLISGSALPANRACIANGGILDEWNAQNYAPRSNELDNALWVDQVVGGVVAPTLNASNSSTDIYGSLVAEEYTFPATAAGQHSLRELAVACPVSTWKTQSVLARAVGYDCTFDLCMWTGSAQVCSPCAATTGGWKLCENFTATSGLGQNAYVGNGTNINGGITRGLCRVLLSGHQCEEGPVATSRIPTTSAAASRNVLIADVDLGAGAPNAGVSMSAAVTLVNKKVANITAYVGAFNISSSVVGDTAGHGMWLYSAATSGSTMRCLVGDNASLLFPTSSGAGGSGLVRGWCSSGGVGATLTGSWAGASLTASPTITAGTWAPSRYLRIAGQSLGQSDTFKREFCIDHNPMECR